MSPNDTNALKQAKKRYLKGLLNKAEQTTVAPSNDRHAHIREHSPGSSLNLSMSEKQWRYEDPLVKITYDIDQVLKEVSTTESAIKESQAHTKTLLARIGQLKQSFDQLSQQRKLLEADR
jgi:hypothetical protein